MAGEVEEIRVIDSEIPDHWERATFRQLLKEGSLELVQDGNHGGAYPKPDEFEATGIPIITGADLNAGAIDLRGCKFLKPASAERLRIGFAKQGDVLLTHKGTMGKTAIVPHLSWPYIILNPQLTLYRVSRVGRLNGRFLKFFFDGKPFQAFLERISGISTISTLSLTVQKSLEIPLPPLAEQKAIAAVLGALDDKIELNRRMNATLEAMARALFQSWFVDFDPVRAKLDNRKPAALDPATAALFPAAFEESSLGPIPLGWEVSKLKDLTSKIGSGATPRGGSEVYVDQGPALIRSQNVYDNEFHWQGLARLTDKSAVELKNVEVMKDDVLLNITGDSILRTCVVDPAALPARVNQHVAIIRASKDIPPRYLHLYLVQDAMKSFLIGMSAGATRHAITKGHLESTDLLKPPTSVLAAFERLTTPWFDRIDSNRTQSRTLATLRDTLLPKLLSGELSVAEDNCKGK
jgi:type I restriction enzyme S subunit